MKFTTYLIAEISTSHITANDGLLLSNPCAPFRVAELDPCDPSETKGPGAIFSVPNAEIEPAHLHEMEDFGFSTAFIALMRALHYQDIMYVRFDRDGTKVEGAPVFQW